MSRVISTKSGRFVELWFAAALLAACNGVERVYLPLPELGSERALILAVEEPETGGFRMLAGDRNGSLEIPVADTVSMYLLAYERSLEELGLDPGSTFEPSPSPSHCARLEPDDVFAASGAIDELRWTAADLPRAIEAELIDSPEDTCTPCLDFDQEEINLPGTGWPMFGASAGDDVLVAIDNGPLVRITPNVEIAELCTLPGRVRSGARRESDQSLVIGTEDGTIFQVLDLSTCAVAQLGRVEGTPSRIALSRSGPLVAYVLSDLSGESMLWRVDTSSSAKLHQHTLDPALVPPDERGLRGGVVWLGPEHVLFVAGDDAIFRLRDGAITAERLDLPEYRAQSLAVTSSGAIAGVEPAGVAVRDQNGWILPEVAPSFRQVTALLPLDDLVLVGQQGPLEIFDLRTRAFCPRYRQELPQNAPQTMVKLGATDVIVLDPLPREGSLPKVKRLFR